MAKFPTGDQLMADAMEATGLSDFGPGDFRQGLGVLLDSLERDGDFSPETDATVAAKLHSWLVNRLEVEAWYVSHPEIEDLPVRGPVDVMGLPRTGTTALGNMLSLDPQFRSLRMWEQRKPCPPPTSGGEATDPRRLAYADEVDALPADLKAMHLYEVDATVEDSDVLGMAFHGQQMTLPVYTYQAWWRAADSTQAFHYHRRIAKLLQSQRPPNLWLFKAPHHKFHLEAVVAGYPDVKFVMTHRDPGKVVPSYSSIVSAILPPAAGERDVKRLGNEICNHLREGMENCIGARARIGEDCFLDVHHREFLADSIGTAKRVYGFLGLELTPSVEQTMRDWHTANRTGAHGAHKYTAEQFGLTTAQVRSDYDFYIRHFDVDIEG